VTRLDSCGEGSVIMIDHFRRESLRETHFGFRCSQNSTSGDVQERIARKDYSFGQLVRALILLFVREAVKILFAGVNNVEAIPRNGLTVDSLLAYKVRATVF
jgi:hypothetical protein